MLRIGSLAPDFELRLHTGMRFRLSDHAGLKNTVLYFYPRNFTWGCTREGCLFADHIPEVESLDAVLVGVNNASLEDHRQFATEYHFPFPLASDPRLEVCRNYRAVWLGGKAIRRATYIIDKQRMVRGVAHYEFQVERHWTYVKRILRQLHDEESVRAYNRRSWNL